MSLTQSVEKKLVIEEVIIESIKTKIIIAINKATNYQLVKRYYKITIINNTIKQENNPIIKITPTLKLITYKIINKITPTSQIPPLINKTKTI